MIYLFSGDDTKNKIKNYESFFKKESLKIPLFSINKNNFNQMDIESFYSDSNLFEEKSIIVFFNILEKEEIENFIIERLKFFQESKNIFVFIEDKLLKPIIDKFNKEKAEVKIFELKKEEKEKFNNFLLADALSNKDKIKLWFYYRQAIDKGVSLEELVGVLFWKVKDMIINKKLFKFKENELKEIADKLSFILPEARKNKKDVEVVLEKFLLEIF